MPLVRPYIKYISSSSYNILFQIQQNKNLFSIFMSEAEGKEL